MSLVIDVFTIFPELFPGPLSTSVTGRGLDQNLWQLNTHNIREAATDKHRTVDDASFGGGPGMVMRPDVLDAALTKVYGTAKPKKLIYLSPRGKTLTQAYAQELSQTESLGILCGRFEGVDQRVLDVWDFEEVSIGDYVLTGGEMAAYVLIDAVVRLIPGVIGEEESLSEESFAQGLLEYPQYTRPREWNSCKIPEVLLSGNHQLIQTWRHEQAKEITRLRRPDLWKLFTERFNVD